LTAWLNLPWVHSALIPFLAGLIVAEVFNRLRLSGLALAAGFTATVALVALYAFQFDLAGSLPRVVAATLAGALIGPVLDLFPGLRPILRYVLTPISAAVALWAVWPAISGRALPQLLPVAAAIVIWGAWIGWTATALAGSSDRAGAVGIALGIALGACALGAGASQLAPLAFALGAASGAYLLIQIVSNQRLPCGLTFGLPLAIAFATLGPATVFTSPMPGYLLVALAILPLAAWLPLSDRLGTAIRALAALAVTATAGAGVIALAWYGAGLRAW